MPKHREASASELSHQFTLEQRRQHADKNRGINLRARISRLPFELLCYIFRHVKDSYTLTVEEEPKWFGPSVTGSRAGPNCWITVAHVCHAWRVVALHTPSLWSHIIASSDELVMEMLRRSKQDPLTIELRSPSACLKGHGILELKKHIPRCRSLSLRQVPTLLPFLLLGGMNASLLEYLDIRYHPDTYSRNRPIVFTDYFRADSLRRLSLENTFIHWRCCALRRLTHLKLIEIPLQNLLPCEEFVDVLSNISALEVLHLSGCFSDCSSDSGDFLLAPKTQRSLFGCLKIMYLSFDIREMALFLDYIMVTPSCRLFLSTWNEDPTPLGLLELIFDWLEDHFEQAIDDNDFSSSDLRTIRFRMHHDECSLRGYNKMVTFDQTPEPRDKIFEFAYLTEMCTDMYQLDESTLQYLFLSLPLSRLQAATLCIENDELGIQLERVLPYILHLSESFFRDVLGSLSTLEELFLKLPVNNLACALLPTPDEPMQLPFPALTSLILDDNERRYREVFDSLRQRSALTGLRMKEVLIPAKPATWRFWVKGFVAYRRPISQLDDLLTGDSPSELRIFRCNASDRSNNSDSESAFTDSDHASSDSD